MVLSSLQRITPEIAKIYLKQNPMNRPISEGRVGIYAAAMEAGEWLVNGEPIILSSDGSLLDGQHRLLAVILSDNAVDMLVVTGVDAAGFHTIDQGAARSVADILGILGEEHSKTLAAAARWIYTFEVGTPFMLSGKKTPSVTRLRSIVEQNPGLRDSIVYLESIGCYLGKGGSRVITPSVAATIHYMLSKVSQPDADVFFRGLITGADLHAESPIYKLRERLTAAKELQLKHLTTRARAGMMVKCWNAYRHGETMKKVSFKTGKKAEEFPTPI